MVPPSLWPGVRYGWAEERLLLGKTKSTGGIIPFRGQGATWFAVSVYQSRRCDIKNFQFLIFDIFDF